MKTLPLVLFCLLFFEILHAQDTLRLPNPSFEVDDPKCYQVPTHWDKMGKTDHSPSIQPSCHEVSKSAAHGLRYVSLLRYADGTRQCIGAKFQAGGEMKKGEGYEIGLHMAQAKAVKVDKRQFTATSGLRIWAVNSQTDAYEVLAETASIDHPEWKNYSITVSPAKGNYDMLYFEPCPVLEEQKDGNILIDNILPVVRYRGEKTSRIALRNPSFEDLPNAGWTPTGWTNYGASTETPPDIQPGAFECTLAPHDGASYLGLVVRDNDTWESIGQPLNVPLQRDSQYVFTVWLAKAPLYMSTSKTTNLPANYAIPVVLRIWGSNGPNDRELLATSGLVTNTTWLKSHLVLQPRQGTWNHLIIEAYYKEPTLFAYNGNILIDQCSLSAVRN